MAMCVRFPRPSSSTASTSGPGCTACHVRTGPGSFPISSSTAARSRVGRRAGAGCDDQDRIIGVLGWIHARKRYETAIRLLATLEPKFRLWLIGSPPNSSQAYSTTLKALADELGVADRMTITGYVEEDELAQRMAALDVGLCPYRDASASGSMSTLLSARRPIVANHFDVAAELAELAPGAITLLSDTDMGAYREAVLDARASPRRRCVRPGPGAALAEASAAHYLRTLRAAARAGDGRTDSSSPRAAAWRTTRATLRWGDAFARRCGDGSLRCSKPRTAEPSDPRCSAPVSLPTRPTRSGGRRRLRRGPRAVVGPTHRLKRGGQPFRREELSAPSPNSSAAVPMSGPRPAIRTTGPGEGPRSRTHPGRPAPPRRRTHAELTPRRPGPHEDRAARGGRRPRFVQRRASSATTGFPRSPAARRRRSEP